MTMNDEPDRYCRTSEEKVTEFLFKRAEKEAEKSGDTSTKVGAVLVVQYGGGKGWSILGSECNDLPSGVMDRPERRERPIKYKFVCHAETKAIAAAAKRGYSTSGAVMYTTHHPCSDCAKLIIQAGIHTVHWDKGTFAGEWSDDLAIASTMLMEAGVNMIERNKKS